MLACIACSKRLQLEGGGDESARGPSVKGSSREGVKSLISQIKDVVLKFSGSRRQRKGGSTTSSLRSGSFLNHHQHQHRHGSSYTYEDASKHGHSVPAASSSSSTPAWELCSAVDVDESRMRAKWIPGASTAAAEEGVVMLEEDGEPREWIAQVEPGVHITFVSLPGGAGNDLKRIRFSQEMFNKWRAQRWWGENYDRIMELYNVQRYNRQALQTPARSDDGERESMWSVVGSTRESPVTPPTIAAKERLAAAAPRDTPPPLTSFAGKELCCPSHVAPHRLHPSGLRSVDAASRITTSSRDDAWGSTSDACDLDVIEWVERDEPGVHITIRKLADGARVLRRVRFSRDKFGEMHAKLWLEANRERIQAQYLKNSRNGDGQLRN